MNRNRKPNGFTLVEMLVALAIFGTVMAGISIVFISALRAWQTSRENRSVFEMGRGALRVMEQDMTAAFGSLERDELQTLVGGPDWLTFVGLTENPKTGRLGWTPTPHSDMSRITYRLLHETEVADEWLLLRLVQLDLDDVGTEPAIVLPGLITDETVEAWNRIIEAANPGMATDPELRERLEVHAEDFELASNVLGLQFRYRDVMPATGAVVWVNNWDSRNRPDLDRKLPDAIEVAIWVRAEAKIPTEETKTRVFRSTIFLPLGYRRPLPAVFQ